MAPCLVVGLSMLPPLSSFYLATYLGSQQFPPSSYLDTFQFFPTPVFQL